jgi:site-specific recombinase XerD
MVSKVLTLVCYPEILLSDKKEKEDAMNKKIIKDLYEIFERYSETVETLKRVPEIIMTYCTEVCHFLYWRADCNYQFCDSNRATSQDNRTYLKDLKRFNPQEVCDPALPTLRPSLPLRQLTDVPKNNPTYNLPDIWNAQRANIWLDGEQQRQLEVVIDQQLQSCLGMVGWAVNWIRSAALVRFLLHTGMYSVEVRVLRLGDIHLGETRGVVQVRGRRERRVPLDGPTCAALRIWLTVRPEGEADWLWLEGNKREARLLSEHGIWRACRRIAQMAGLDPEAISPRILRNTCAHNLLVAGESLRVVKRLLKFSTNKIVMRYLQN